MREILPVAPGTQQMVDAVAEVESAITVLAARSADLREPNPSETVPEPFDEPFPKRFAEPTGVGVGAGGVDTITVSSGSPCVGRENRGTTEDRPHLELVPDDEEPEPTPAPTPKPKTRGTRIPEGFMPTDESIRVIRETFPAVTSADLELRHANFRDYWAAATGQGATKRDWDAAWRNWMRRDFDSPRFRGAGAKVGPTAREVKRAKAEALKDNPDPAVLAAGGLSPAPAVEATGGQQSITTLIKELTA